MGAVADAASQANANYPTRPLRMVVPFSPGGASDIIGRIISSRLSEELGQQIVVDNRAGADGNVGAQIAASAVADGHTFLFGSVGVMSINPSVYLRSPLKPTRDFIGVTQVADVPGSLTINPSLPVNSVRELINYAKARPGKLNYGSSGTGSVNQLQMEFFMRASGIDLVHIPFKGGAPSTLAVLANEVQLTFSTLSASMIHVKSGRLKILAVIAPKRQAEFPDVPTLAESGFPSMTTGTWQGLFFPKGTRRLIVDKLYGATFSVLERADVKKRVADVGADVVTSRSPEAFTAFVESETERWAKLVKEVGLVVK
jgi:tripartite-type tricarboxylate transporter receptor subunit TctC